MVAVGYVRVSTHHQALEGISPDAQQSRIHAWCQAHGHQLHRVFIETMSAARADNRPQLQSALQQTCQLKGALVVYSLSRLARSTKDALTISEQLDRSGADLVSLSERIDSTSPVGKMIFRLLSALNEFEKDQLSERTRQAMAHLRQCNRRISAKIPMGYVLAPDGVNLIEDPGEQALIQKIRRWRQRGWSLRKIAQRLQDNGVPTKNNARWYPATVLRILERQRKLAA